MLNPPHASRAQILRFRLKGHNLTELRPVTALKEVAGACGIRNTPPGSAALGLLARIEGLAPRHVDQALGPGGALVEVLSMRASPLLVPRVDVGVFTIGALPRTEAAMEAVLANHKSVLKDAGVSATEALELAVAAAHKALAQGGLPRGELSGAITRQLPKRLQAWCEPCKIHHVPEMLFRLVGVRGEYIITRQGQGSTYVRSDTVLGKQSKAHAEDARAELLRRYLRCYGPTTATDFAAWVGIASSEVQEDWEHVAGQLIEVDIDGREGWIHRDDADVLRDPPAAHRVRLLPPYDAYLDQRDRVTLIPNKSLHKRVWRAIGNPGVVLHDGEAVGTWRTQKKGKRLIVTAEPFDEFSRPLQKAISEQAELLAPFRDCTTVEAVYGT
jgi:hypothetical protein